LDGADAASNVCESKLQPTEANIFAGPDSHISSHQPVTCRHAPVAYLFEILWKKKKKPIRPGPKTPLRNLHGVSGGSASFRFLEGVVIIIRHFEISPRALEKICHEVAESS